MEIKEIDGSQGEGGGQILRTSLSLSACTGQPIRIRNIRSGRKKPGLMRQHLICVRAAAEVCNAKVKGASIGSKSVEFIPGDISAGDYHYSIGSAGSTTLVFQTVLPLLLGAKEPSSLVFEGGTHNPLAPNYDFLRDAYLPMLGKMGLSYKISIDKYGFYPVGGGRWSIELTPPDKYRKLKVVETRGAGSVKAKCIGAGLPDHVLKREKKQLLKRWDWPESTISTETVPAFGSGNVVIISAQYENTCEVVDSIGAVGIRAEKVALDALKKWHKYKTNGAPVGEYLADQLLLPLVVTEGGCYVTGKLSEHALTNIEVIKQIANVSIKVLPTESKQRCRIVVGN